MPEFGKRPIRFFLITILTCGVLLILLGVLEWWMMRHSATSFSAVSRPSSISSKEATTSGTSTNSTALVPSLSPSPSPAVTPQPTPRLFISAWLFTHGPFAQPLSPTAQYIREDRIGTLRPSLENYSTPIYRINGANVVKVINQYGGRTVEWPIPLFAHPASGSDHSMAVFDQHDGISYELWNAEWQGNQISAGGMQAFPFAGDGLSHPKNQRVTAAGFAQTAGMVIQEDFGVNGHLSSTATIHHALVISIPHQLILRNGFASPAELGEAQGDNTGDIPLGTRFALPKTANIEALQLHPLAKSLAIALRDYGAFVGDRNNAGQYQGKYVATVKIEPGLTQKIYGIPTDALDSTIQQQLSQVINTYGLYRVN